MKRALILLLALTLALALTACRQETPKHPIVAIWTQDYEDGNTRVMFSFEAVGDAEVVVWRYDAEEDALVESESYIGEYVIDESDSSVTLELKRDKQLYEAKFTYAIDGDTLTLRNDEYDLTLDRAGENTVRQGAPEIAASRA